jgi:uncharacterized Zn-binding protein involved in type VI secretion
MPAVHRLGDAGTGHGCWPPRSNSGSSPNVAANGILVHRQGDGWPPHSCPPAPPHGSTLAAGSGTVYANGKQLGRIGDPIACGGSAAAGSPNVFSG